MTLLLLNLNFLWDDGNETTPVAIITDKNVKTTDAMAVIAAYHEKLCRDESGKDLYGINGRNAETLMNYICANEPWSWHTISDTIDLN